MALEKDERQGFYDRTHPCYMVFDQENETFSNFRTQYTDDYAAFCEAYQQDLKAFVNVTGMMAKPNIPTNTFPAFMIPWESFDGFNINLQNGYRYLLLIFTIGCAQQCEEKWRMPLAIQINHAACGGLRVCRSIASLKEQVVNSVLLVSGKEM